MEQSENRLVSVVEHWLPRIEVAGIPSATARAVIEHAGVWQRWLPVWSEEGERHAALGDEALAAGRLITAGEAYARASLFYHFGQFMVFDDLEGKAAAAARKAELYRKAAPLLDPPGELITIPFEGGELRGCLRLPHGGGSHPLAIIIPGSDSTKEEFPAFERHFHARDIATLSLDGPGQGEGRIFGALRPDIGSAVLAAIQAVDGRERLSGQVGLVGMAFGGLLVLRAAAMVPDIAGIVSINGFYDLGGFWADLPQVYRDNMRFALGGENVRERADLFTLRGCDPPRAPALILHGGRDKIFPPSEAEKCAEFCALGADLYLFPDGNHVCNNIPWLYRPLIADWLKARFAGRNFTATA
ncbi:alpha/beta hydrolase [Pararhizobium sp. BT-229]|uniref:alpha/beta hydrolase family protein n=1 Tax=Pararhizobium sp. BT-229 TaxID=2986923 RepID=UPI0021F7B117|nr:alpha/beta hydrolase [Pararhizobium sp. BT-229]MCV9960911.1 alpha/beta hydrolase [Pararhizobium sp. BT-229]